MLQIAKIGRSVESLKLASCWGEYCLYGPTYNTDTWWRRMVLPVVLLSRVSVEERQGDSNETGFLPKGHAALILAPGV